MNLEKRLDNYINSLDKDIKRLREQRTFNQIRNMINESDANLIEEIKLDLIKILEGEW